MEKGFNKRDLILATGVEEQRMSIKKKTQFNQFFKSWVSRKHFCTGEVKLICFSLAVN